MVFDKQWFKKYNNILVKIAKIPFIGEWIFCIKKYGCSANIKNICGILPNAIIELQEEEKIKYYFFVNNEFSIRIYKIFYPIWITFHIWDILTRPFPQLNLGFDTFEPQTSGGGSKTCCDGYAGGPSTAAPWSNIRDGESPSADTTSTLTHIASVQAGNANDYWGTMNRGFMSFDTSSLSDTLDITSCKLSLYLTYVSGQLSNRLAICKSVNQSNLNNIVKTDYYNTRNNATRVVDDVTYTSLTTGQYNDFTFNAVGLSYISKTGVTGLTLKSKADADNIKPTWSSGNPWDAIKCYFSDYGSNKPQLIVVASVGPANVKTYKGLAAASVKTCKGLAIASVKSKKGLA